MLYAAGLTCVHTAVLTTQLHSRPERQLELESWSGAEKVASSLQRRAGREFIIALDLVYGSNGTGMVHSALIED